MKKLSYLFIMVLSCILWSCSKGDGHIDEPDVPNNPDNPTEVFLGLSTTDLVFEAKGGVRKFTVYCDTDWTITNESDWCTTNVTEGNGDGKVAVTVEGYSETEDRNTNLTIKAGNRTEVLTVTQKHGDAIILSKDKFDVPQEGGEIAIEVKSNIEYQVTIPSKFQAWIKQTPQSKAVTVKNFTFTVSANEAYDKREGYIVFSGNSLKDTVHIYQTADARTLILTKDTYNVSSTGELLEVELKTNVNYDISIPRTATDWITLIQTRAIRTDKIHFEIKENTSYDNRTAKIVIKDRYNSLSDTLYINQVQRDALILDKKQYNVSAAGGEISIKVQSNIEYKVTIPQAAQNWIQKIPQSKGLATSTLNYKVLANPTENVRTAKIIIQDKNSALADTVQVSQDAKGMYTGDIIFKTEQDLIDFHAAGYTKVMGNVIVTGENITTLQKLDNLLTEINGSLKLECYSLTTLDGLYGLKTITDSLIIKRGRMTSLEGLRNLEMIGENFEVNASSSLTALKTFEGLESLQTIGGNFKVIASSEYVADSKFSSGHSQSLTALTSFQGLSGLKSIGGDFKVIASSYSRSSYLYNKSSESSSLTALTSFQGLSGLKSIGGDFEVNVSSVFSSEYDTDAYDNNSNRNFSNSSSLPALKSFEGLEGLQTIGGNFKVIASSSSSSMPSKPNSTISSIFSSNSSNSLIALTSFYGLSSLKSIGGDFEVSAPSSSYRSKSLTALKTFEGLENLQTIGGNFYSNKSISTKGLSLLNNIGGDFAILISSDGGGLENLVSIGGSFRPYGDSFKTLRKLSSIGKDFYVNGFNGTSFEGLENLQTIGGNFYSNKSISTKGLSLLNNIGGDFAILISSDGGGLENLVSIGGSFSPYGDSFKTLRKLSSIGKNFYVSNFKGTSFEGLENLRTIGSGKITIGHCESLNNIDALKNVESINDISITNCDRLYDFCVLKNIVQNMSGTFYVNGNGYNPTKYQLLNGECSKQPE